MNTGQLIAIVFSFVSVFASGFTLGLLAERHRAHRGLLK
jgi:hypothetical protein